MKLNNFGRLVLELHDASQALSATRFQDWAVTRLRDEISFTAAWWGVATIEDGGTRMLHSACYGLHDNFLHEWKAIEPRDDLRDASVGRPGVTALKAGHSADRDLYRFDQRHGLHSALSTTFRDKSGKLAQFISLFRPESAAPFGRRERDLKQLIVPHLIQAWGTSWNDAPADSAQPGALLAADGRLICADDHFLATMYAAWPEWNGKHIDLTATPGAGFNGPQAATAKIAIRTARGNVPGTVRVSVSENPRSVLSKREREVAEPYAAGLSYKEIAKDLKLSPATVRSYMKSCYEKLAVSNKAQLLVALRSGRIT